jgi:Protein of unknown function (DUF2690)
MSKFLTAFVLLLLLSQLAAPTTTVSAGTAVAATCYGSACNGLNPFTTGCSADGYIVSEVDIYDNQSNYVGIVYRYWSPTCQAAWTRVISDFRADGVQAYVSSSSPSNSYSQSSMNVYTATSPMVYSTAVTYTTSCGSIQEGSLLASACTP